MIVASTFASDQIVPVLARLNRGERVDFSHAIEGLHAFSVRKTGSAYVLQDRFGCAIGSASTFAEIWRARPRLAASKEASR